MKLFKLSLVFVFYLGIVTPCLAQARKDFPYLAEVISDNVNVRAGQNENFEKLGKLAKGEKVVVVGRSYSWDKIKLPSNCAAHVNESFLQNMGDGLAMSKGDRVNIRAGRGTNFSVIGTLKKGTLVRILEQKDGWYKIEPVEGSYGWIQTSYLKFISKQVPPARVVEPPVKAEPVAAPPLPEG